MIVELLSIIYLIFLLQTPSKPVLFKFKDKRVSLCINAYTRSSIPYLKQNYLYNQVCLIYLLSACFPRDQLILMTHLFLIALQFRLTFMILNYFLKAIIFLRRYSLKAFQLLNILTHQLAFFCTLSNPSMKNCFEHQILKL